MLILVGYTLKFLFSCKYSFASHWLCFSLVLFHSSLMMSFVHTSPLFIHLHSPTCCFSNRYNLFVRPMLFSVNVFSNRQCICFRIDAMRNNTSTISTRLLNVTFLPFFFYSFFLIFFSLGTKSIDSSYVG